MVIDGIVLSAVPPPPFPLSLFTVCTAALASIVSKNHVALSVLFCVSVLPALACLTFEIGFAHSSMAPRAALARSTSRQCRVRCADCGSKASGWHGKDNQGGSST